MPMQVFRSNTTAKRPTPAAMADGQLAVNTAATSTGLFFKDAAANLVKAGPIHVGTAAPNATPASGGHAGHCLGESWLDTTGTNPVQKIWNGSAWIIPQPSATATVVTTGDTGTVTSTMILNGTIVDADINSAAAIAGSKVSPNFGSQNIVNTGTITTKGAIAIDAGAIGITALEIGTNPVGDQYSFIDLIGDTTYSDYGVRFARNPGANAGATIVVRGNGVFDLHCQDAGAVAISTSASERMRVDASGNVLIGTSSSTGDAKLQVNGDKIRVGTAKTPASSSDTGTVGEICWDSNYVYVCTASNTWKRSAIATW